MNVYSYESDLSLGGEWWVGRRKRRDSLVDEGESRAQGVVSDDGKVMQKEEDGKAEAELDSPIPLIKESHPSAVVSSAASSAGENRDGVIKARLNGNWVSFPTLNPPHTLSSAPTCRLE